MASMEPQFKDCGNVLKHLQSGRSISASMEPQFKDCGNRSGGNSKWTSYNSFNGAAVQRLRKPFKVVDMETGYSGFNGAAVQRLRKHTRNSMNKTKHGTLQWSRSSKTAETRYGERKSIQSLSASMEPQFKDCGNL